MLRHDYAVAAAAAIREPLADRFRAFPPHPVGVVNAVRCTTALALRAWLRLYHRMEIVGRENLPRHRSFVMVANHSSHLDALCMLSALPLRSLGTTYPAAAEDYFFVNLPRMAAARIFVNALPFSRQGHVRQSLNLCRRLLRQQGNVLILFPEGTRSAGGELGEFRPGIAGVVAGLDVPVVPCAVVGAARALPKGRLIPRPRQLRLIIGISRTYAELEPGKDSSRHIVRDLHDAVKELLCAPVS